MIKQFVRLAIVATVWRRYKSSIISVAALLLFWFVVSFFHGEYISYAEATGERQFLAVSFFIKWGLGMAALSAFILFHLRAFRKSADRKENPQASKKEHLKGEKQKPKTQKVKDKPEIPPAPKPGDEAYKASEDPFAALRDKPKLRSRADVELSKKGR
ncbi:hypothetical protein [Pseudoteredinibacter isoporae]|uniref:Putative membrane protein n=1 Tax=Pseudoteredinibacter isoporae TaxID=570281 RepID=A0A7X0JV51_9GAMM|nr:hypothetical protein [Pseudoteredinibacter isoporae]MBB6522308.1 putative membrane protein [Pseudoteredinibacter isoporae]NHO87841.1 hypothetical protein [Pseudoteredinibacter isoporae]NIB23828.1 hypothetical protein [Pseudoteredinibacter isoporae]